MSSEEDTEVLGNLYELTLDHLPDVVLLKVLSYLDYKDLTNCCLACRCLNACGSIDSLWRYQCQECWLLSECRENSSWKDEFRMMYRNFGRYISVYATIKRAWNKIERFTKDNLPALYNDLNDGVSETELDTLERKHKVEFPDDLRCSYRIHNGQKSGDENSAAGLLGSLSVYHIFRNETLCPVSVTYQFMDQPEEFVDTHMLSYCYRTKEAQLIALSDLGGHTAGEVFYQVPDSSVLNSGEGIFIMDKFITAKSYTEWLVRHADHLEQKMYSVYNGLIHKFCQEPSFRATSNHVEVSATTAFLPVMSSIHPPNFSFAYHVSFKMAPEAPQSASCQLMTRHWIITDDDGKEERVNGPGVIGQFPTVTPGSTFSWVSCTNFSTTHGSMRGYFTMRNLSTGQPLEIECPVFHMTCPPYQTWDDRKRIVQQRKKQQQELGLPKTRDVIELEEEEQARYMYGFPGDIANELLSYGVKPWDDDAFDFLDQLHAARQELESDDSENSHEGPSDQEASNQQAEEEEEEEQEEIAYL